MFTKPEISLTQYRKDMKIVKISSKNVSDKYSADTNIKLTCRKSREIKLVTDPSTI